MIVWVAMLAISSRLLDELKAEAVKALPYESCGVLAGEDGIVAGTYPVMNTAPIGRYLIPAEAITWVDRRAHILGFFHSHPGGSAIPSVDDLAKALPGMAYLILSVRGERVVDAKAWVLAGDVSWKRGCASTRICKRIGLHSPE